MALIAVGVHQPRFPRSGGTLIAAMEYLAVSSIVLTLS